MNGATMRTTNPHSEQEDLDGTKLYDSITVARAEGETPDFESWAKSWDLSEDTEGFGLAQIAWNEAIKQAKGV
jgi:hypothetical protein